MNHAIPYGRQWVDQKDIDAVAKVLKGDLIAQGPQVEQFEKVICDCTGAKYAVAVSNGTAALHLSVAALEIPAGSEGITSPITFVASSNCLIYNQIKPKFADIDSKTFCIDPTEIEKNITKKTKVIVAVDFAGQPAEMEKIHKIARSRDIFVVEDAAHALGSKYKNGAFVGSNKYSDLTIFSFHPVKTITTGEGGAITTNNKKLYDKLVLLRSHGITKNPDLFSQNPGPWYYEMLMLGYNYRMTDIQAALGISQFNKLDRFIKRRREIVQRYNESFSKVKNVVTPYERPGLFSAFHLYVLLIDFDKIGWSRKDFMDKLREKRIGTQVLYIPVYHQPYYQKNFGYKAADFPVAEAFYQKTLSLPLYPKLSDIDVSYVIKNFRKVLER
jgi:UDP-4-amino-4,6-dideoxy-N-acetyl-beta-L-altrosamine transaminase